MKTKIITVTATLVALSGCALGTPPMDIKPDQVDASLYANLSCDQMQDQYQQLLQDKEKYAARQKNRNARSRSMAIWVAGFGLGDGEEAAHLAHTKGELVALETAAGNSGCGLVGTR